MDSAVLLQPKRDDSPSGDNLEYDPTFTEMELAAQPGEEIRPGEKTATVKDPDYSEVETSALAVLGQSHDLRAAVFLADAVLHSEGLVGFADVTTVMRGYLEQFWESCHPQLDEDDGDPTMRVNAVQDLCGQPDDMAGPSPTYRSLRRVALSDSRGFGRFSLRDIEIAEGFMTAPEGMETIPDTVTVGAAFQDSDNEVLAQRLAAVQVAVENIQAITVVFDEQLPGQGPELAPLVKLLRQISNRISEYGSLEAAPQDFGLDEDFGEEASVQASAGSKTVSVGGINSPSDVSNALDRIISYYQRAEPSSPVPVLLERAKRLVGADFLTIVNDMAPQGISNVHLIGGIDDD